MDNHKESECFKKNRRSRQGKIFKKPTHTANQNETRDDAEVLNVAEAFQGSSLTSKRSRSPSPTISKSSAPIQARLGPKSQARRTHSPYQGIFPQRSTESNIVLDPTVLEIHNYDDMIDSGKTLTKTLNKIQFFNQMKFQTTEKSQHSETTIKRLKSCKPKTMNFTNNNYSLNSICNKRNNMNKIMNSKIQTNWIIGSGATIHMCNQKELLTDYVIKEGRQVTISDGSNIPIEGFGKLRFNIKGDDNLQHTFILEDVAFVPKLTVNLISLKELTLLNVTVEFSNHKCKIIHKQSSITIGTLMNSSYVMKLAHNDLKQSVIKQSQLCIHDWHRKLSHRNIHHIKQIKH